jgi:hypothetical protein
VPDTIEDVEWVIQPGDISFQADPSDINKRIRRIRDNGRTTVEERGVTTLHVSVGALRWNDPKLGDSTAPIWLVPCAISSDGPDQLLLEATEDEPQLNPALALFLREQHKRSLVELPDEPTTGVISRLLADLRAQFPEPEWRVLDDAWLSTFSFETLAMYRDLEAMEATALTNDVVLAFADGLDEVETSEALPIDLDRLAPNTEVPLTIRPADSSQLDALTRARSGRHLLVYGPPGTGKSQTIANLIADALAREKTVLFVSAKLAALEVVFDRLRDAGLDRFCLEAHSVKSGKASIMDDLRRTLDAATQGPPLPRRPTRCGW